MLVGKWKHSDNGDFICNELGDTRVVCVESHNQDTVEFTWDGSRLKLNDNVIKPPTVKRNIDNHNVIKWENGDTWTAQGNSYYYCKWT